MKTKAICLITIMMLAGLAFGNDSLRCRMIDWLDAYETSEVDTIANFDYGSVDATGVTICDSTIYLVGGGCQYINC